MSKTFSPAAVDDERGSMDAAAKLLPIDAQVRRFLRYAPAFEGKRIVEGHIADLEKRLAPTTKSEFEDAVGALLVSFIKSLPASPS